MCPSARVVPTFELSWIIQAGGIGPHCNALLANDIASSSRVDRDVTSLGCDDPPCLSSRTARSHPPLSQSDLDQYLTIRCPDALQIVVALSLASRVQTVEQEVDLKKKSERPLVTRDGYGNPIDIKL